MQTRQCLLLTVKKSLALLQFRVLSAGGAATPDKCDWTPESPALPKTTTTNEHADARPARREPVLDDADEQRASCSCGLLSAGWAGLKRLGSWASRKQKARKAKKAAQEG